MAKPQDKDTEALQIELLNEKIKNLQAQVTKPKTSEEMYQERLSKYETARENREKLKHEIDKRKLELWSKYPKMRSDEIMLIEAWERRAESLKDTNPHFAQQLQYRIREKIKEVNSDPTR